MGLLSKPNKTNALSSLLLFVVRDIVKFVYCFSF